MLGSYQLKSFMHALIQDLVFTEIIVSVLHCSGVPDCIYLCIDERH